MEATAVEEQQAPFSLRVRKSCPKCGDAMEPWIFPPGDSRVSLWGCVNKECGYTAESDAMLARRQKSDDFTDEARAIMDDVRCYDIAVAAVDARGMGDAVLSLMGHIRTAGRLSVQMEEAQT